MRSGVGEPVDDEADRERAGEALAGRRRDRVPLSPGRDVLLVQEVADAREVAAAAADLDDVPRLALVAGVRNEDVGVLCVDRASLRRGV